MATQQIDTTAADRLLAPAAALAVAVLAVQLPVTIYSGSPGDFDFGLLQLVPAWACLAGACFLLVVGIARRLSAAARGRLASLLWAVAIWAWVSGNVVVFQFGRLTGAPLEFGDQRKWILPEIALAVILLALAFQWSRRRPKTCRRIACLGLVVVALGSAALWARDLPKRGRFSPLWPTTLARFAPQENILVILLDTFQADIFAELVEADDDLAARFDGFTFYPNTLGAARTTALTMPAVHTGLRYEPGWTLDEYFERANERASFLTKAAVAGHEVTMVGPFGFCPRTNASCDELVRLTGSPWVDYWSEVALPLDLSVFRVAPLLAKPRIYGRGRWLSLRLLRVHRGRQQQILSRRFLDRLLADVRIEEGPPTVKFFHLPTPHAPLVTGDDCSLLDEDLPKTRENMIRQSICSLEKVADVFDRLRELKLLDPALVVLMSDHGAGLPPGRAGDEDEDDFLKRMSAANPLLLTKYPGAQGEMVSSDQPVQIDDIGKTICKAAAGCRYRWGRPLTNPAPPRRVRSYLDYKWRTGFWYERGQIDVTAWEVRGPLHIEESWARVEPEVRP